MIEINKSYTFCLTEDHPPILGAINNQCVKVIAPHPTTPNAWLIRCPKGVLHQAFTDELHDGPVCPPHEPKKLGSTRKRTRVMPYIPLTNPKPGDHVVCVDNTAGGQSYLRLGEYYHVRDVEYVLDRPVVMVTTEVGYDVPGNWHPGRFRRIA